MFFACVRPSIIIGLLLWNNSVFASSTEEQYFIASQVVETSSLSQHILLQLQKPVTIHDLSLQILTYAKRTDLVEKYKQDENFQKSFHKKIVQHLQQKEVLNLIEAKLTTKFAEQYTIEQLKAIYHLLRSDIGKSLLDTQQQRQQQLVSEINQLSTMTPSAIENKEILSSLQLTFQNILHEHLSSNSEKGDTP